MRKVLTFKLIFELFLVWSEHRWLWNALIRPNILNIVYEIQLIRAFSVLRWKWIPNFKWWGGKKVIRLTATRSPFNLHNLREEKKASRVGGYVGEGHAVIMETQTGSSLCNTVRWKHGWCEQKKEGRAVEFRREILDLQGERHETWRKQT